MKEMANCGIAKEESLSNTMIETLETLKDTNELMGGIRTGLFGSQGPKPSPDFSKEEPCTRMCAEQTLFYARELRELASEIRARI